VPVATSTVDVSQKAFPVSKDSILAISSLRSRKSLTALRRMRLRSTGVVLDQDLKASCEVVMAKSMSAGEAV